MSEQSTQEKGAPSIAQEASRKFRFVIISAGQGGGNIGYTLKSVLPNNPFMIATNTSSDDLNQLNLPDEQKFKIGGRNVNGAGKNRNLAKNYFKNFQSTNLQTEQKMGLLDTFIGMYEEVLFHPFQQTVVIVTFSPDGGTGSGLGPMLTTTLTNYVNTAKSFYYGGKEYQIDDITNSIPRPVVIGLTPKCSLESGAGNHQNTIECFVDIQKAIDAKIGHFFIADNTLPSNVKYESTKEMYDIINARIAAPLLKFFGVEMNSSIKCMDMQDKINTLRIHGCSGFMSLDQQNKFQFVIPEGQYATRIINMLNYDETNLGEEERKAEETIRRYGMSSVDTISVFFELDKSGLSVDSMSKDLINSSMIGFFGYKSLNSVIENVRENLHRIQLANDKKHAVVQENSTGFSTVKEDASKLNDRFEQQAMDNDALLDLF